MRFYIDAIANRMEGIDLLQEVLDPDEFLLIDFEGLVTNYSHYKSNIESFLGIRNSHVLRHRYFNPDLATANIGIYKKRSKLKVAARTSNQT